ncbi:MAG TPA: peptidase T [Planctomycetaceae bacterium]|nr:peptidase T [Planctomycetaceae bacterium]
MINRQRLLDRFLRYVSIDTTAQDEAGMYPSSPGQITLGQMVVSEMEELGLQEIEHDTHGLLYATVPATQSGELPVVAFNAHFDTSPETTGKDVQPQVIENYAGGDIPLPGDPEQVLRVEANPRLNELIGKTLITTDGTTLLGGDDKAGMAVIMELAHVLMEQPDIAHGPVRILFTCDEEIGHGVDHVDLEKLGADVCYTLDGEGAGAIDTETFSADMAVITIRGVNIHPSIAQGRMVNALRAAGELLAALPRDTLAPECTSGRDGFVHPYTMEGGVAEVKIKVILRDFDTAALTLQADLLRKVAQEVEATIAGCSIQVDIQKQYRNMADGLRQEPRAVAYAEQAHTRLGYESRRAIIRGGTDGSQLTERGLPTPNLSTGQHNPHSPLEWACLDEMVQATEVIVELVQVWAEQPA